MLRMIVQPPGNEAQRRRARLPDRVVEAALRLLAAQGHDGAEGPPDQGGRDKEGQLDPEQDRRQCQYRCVEQYGTQTRLNELAAADDMNLTGQFVAHEDRHIEVRRQIIWDA